MAFHLLRHLVAIAALNISVRGQKMSNIIPNDLQAGFSSDTQVQVSYTGEAVNGFADGTVFEKAGTCEFNTGHRIMLTNFSCFE